MKEKAVWSILGLALAAAVIIPVKGLLIDGVYAWHVRQMEFHLMMAESLVIFLLLGGIWLFLKHPELRWILTSGIVLAFLWCHVILLPILASGGYVCYLYLMGYTVRSRILNQKVKNSFFADFLLGCASVVTLFCLLSAVGVGSIPVLKWMVIVTGVPSVVIWSHRQIPAWCDRRREPVGTGGSWTWKKTERLCLVLIGVMLLIQIGRMNISIDFDSLWYGVRSEYMLDNGHGIYENPGTVGLVYTYSKGLEVLLLPLSDLSSHSYLISFQIWMAVITLAAVYLTGRQYMNRSYALAAAAAVSTIPAIMNMSITAKTDVMTLMVQMVMVLYLIYYLQDKQVKHLIISAGALFFSWTLKPTALVFSTAVFGMAFLYLLGTRQFSLKASWKQWMLLAPVLTAWAGIWGRTMKITGIPVTSVFSSLFLKAGFSMKYPFTGLPLYGDSTGGQPVLVYLAKTISKMLLLPVGPSMDHVVFAWGTSLLFFLLVLVFLLALLNQQKRVEDRNLMRCTFTVLIPFVLVCLVSLAMLGQIDGNYFMLLYVFLILYGFGALSRLSVSGLRKWVSAMVIPILMLNVTMTGVSNWSWSLGFTPVQIRNRGSYNHEEKQREAMAALGNVIIWEILAEHPETRVIAAGNHPEVFAFPCNVQSYDDITSSWGNVALVKTMDAFVEYLDYAETDYLYMQAGEVDQASRCYELMGYLVEAGILTDVIYENGNMLAAVNLEGEYGPEAGAAYEAYVTQYQVRE